MTGPLQSHVVWQLVGEPRLGVIGGDLDRIGDQLGLQLRRLGKRSQTTQRHTSWEAPQMRFRLLKLDLERLELGNQGSTRAGWYVRGALGPDAGSIRSRHRLSGCFRLLVPDASGPVRVQDQCPP